jgi:5'(3')-deoxyribonucleotidase
MRVKGPRIILDVDGVICDYEAHWRAIARSVVADLDSRLRDEFEGAWEIEDRYELTVKEYGEILRRLYTTSPENMRPIPDAVDHVRRLLTRADVFFATTSLVPNPLWEHGRRLWFSRYFNSEGARRLIFLRYKYVLAADYFVDDRRRNVLEWIRWADRGRAILFGDVKEDRVSFWVARNWPKLSTMLV